MKHYLKYILNNYLHFYSKKALFVYLKKKITERFYPQFDTSQLIKILEEIGLKKVGTLFIHSSWDQFDKYTGTCLELIQAILDIIGKEGTLLMPAFPIDQDPKKVFDIKKTPSGAGLLTEIFRRLPGVKRSININHSVCALGPNADFLTKDHHLSKTSWDQYSPYYRLSQVNGTIIMGLGVGKNLRVCTAKHCAESILRTEIYFFSLLFDKTVTYTYIDESGRKGSHTYLEEICEGKSSPKKFVKMLDKSKFIETKLSNLDIYAIDAEYLINKTIDLGRNGITMWTKPFPKKKLFSSIN